MSLMGNGVTRAGAFEARNERIEDSDHITIGPVVCTLADQESSSVIIRFWLEEAMLEIGHTSTKFVSGRIPALGKHV